MFTTPIPSTFHINSGLTNWLIFQLIAQFVHVTEDHLEIGPFSLIFHICRIVKDEKCIQYCSDTPLPSWCWLRRRRPSWSTIRACVTRSTTSSTKSPPCRPETPSNTPTTVQVIPPFYHIITHSTPSINDNF